jgi:hypothetical protein
MPTAPACVVSTVWHPDRNAAEQAAAIRNVRIIMAS